MRNKILILTLLMVLIHSSNRPKKKISKNLAENMFDDDYNPQNQLDDAVFMTIPMRGEAEESVQKPKVYWKTYMKKLQNYGLVSESEDGERQQNIFWRTYMNRQLNETQDGERKQKQILKTYMRKLQNDELENIDSNKLNEEEDGEQKKIKFWKTYMKELQNDELHKIDSGNLNEAQDGEQKQKQILKTYMKKLQNDELENIESNKQEHSRLLDPYPKITYDDTNVEKDDKKFMKQNWYSKSNLKSFENMPKFKSLENTPHWSARLSKKENSRMKFLDDVFEVFETENLKNENQVESNLSEKKVTVSGEENLKNEKEKFLDDVFEVFETPNVKNQNQMQSNLSEKKVSDNDKNLKYKKEQSKPEYQIPSFFTANDKVDFNGIEEPHSPDSGKKNHRDDEKTKLKNKKKSVLLASKVLEPSIESPKVLFVKNQLRLYIWNIFEKVELKMENEKEWNDIKNGEELLMKNEVKEKYYYTKNVKVFPKSVLSQNHVKELPQKEFQFLDSPFVVLFSNE